MRQFMHVHAIVIAENATGLLMQNIGKMPPCAAANLSLFRSTSARQLMLANNVLIFSFMMMRSEKRMRHAMMFVRSIFYSERHARYSAQLINYTIYN
jgi:hypothetical protein